MCFQFSHCVQIQEMLVIWLVFVYTDHKPNDCEAIYASLSALRQGSLHQRDRHLHAPSGPGRKVFILPGMPGQGAEDRTGADRPQDRAVQKNGLPAVCVSAKIPTKQK